MMYQVPGYTRRMEREWYYSEKVQQLLSDYMAKCVLPTDLCTTLTYLAVRFASSTSDVVFLTGGLKLWRLWWWWWYFGYIISFTMSVPVQLIAWKDRPRNDLLCVERDVKHLLTHPNSIISEWIQNGTPIKLWLPFLNHQLSNDGIDAKHFTLAPTSVPTSCEIR